MDWMEPMEPVLIEGIKFGENYIHQVKWDGIRGLTYVTDGTVRIFNKSGRERTGFYPEAESIAKLLTVKDAVFDGELIVLDGYRPSFQLALKRDRIKSHKNLPTFVKMYPVRYVVFDLLYYHGEDLRQKPLKDRLNILRSSFKTNENITITDDFSKGENLYNLMKEKNFEGIVSKDLDSPYISGKKHRFWYKTKIQKSMAAVVFGVNLKKGLPNSLILGVYDEGKPKYIGSASVGLKNSDFEMLNRYKEKLSQEKSPFSKDRSFKDVIWFKPLLTCWVSFMEWTNDGSLRHPKILGFADIPPLEVNGEEIST